jgi:uncharacterized FAD-dependent dehydrogenase
MTSEHRKRLGDSSPDQVEVSIGVDDPDDIDSLRRLVAQKLKQSVDSLPQLYVKKRALDARRGKVQFHFLLSSEEDTRGELGLPHPRECGDEPDVIIVGDGPAGLFCAYQLARAGIDSTVIDRGKAVQPRRRDLKLLNARGGVNEESNYCFGEGGAGTYSDGKLYTRSHKRGPVRDVIEVLALHGAPSAILTEARPHIGSNLLPEVISAMRERLEACGVRFLFNTKMVGLEAQGKGDDRKVSALRLEDVDTKEAWSLSARAVVLATGHSARDVFEMGAEWGVRLEPKGFALGVRIEHPQALINEIQFGRYAGHEKIGAAAYKVAEQVEGRGVFSFCMCPGGWIVPAMTDAEHLVVNGMSLSKRDSPYANSGFVVGVEPDDVASLGLTGPLAGVQLQRMAEAAACQAGGGENRAPAIRVTDFLEGRESSTLPETSYLPGLTAADVGQVLDSTGLSFSTKMKEALRAFDRRLRGYISEEAVLVGVESRTSAPVRMVRDPDTLQTREISGLYPCGEGPGYAGGIVSAAVDGLRVADQVALSLKSRAPA